MGYGLHMTRTFWPHIPNMTIVSYTSTIPQHEIGNSASLYTFFQISHLLFQRACSKLWQFVLVPSAMMMPPRHPCKTISRVGIGEKESYC